MAGVGIDIVEIDRIERALERRPRLRERLFHAGEIEQSAGRLRPARHLAARFAAKEAALKALGVSGVVLRDFEVVGGGEEQPRLVLHGSAAAAARERGIELEVSLSHSRELAVAAVVSTPRASAS